MFTGIVQGQAKVTRIERSDNFMHLKLQLPRCNGLSRHIISGCSIAVNGVCLTAVGRSVEHQKGLVGFDLMQETLEKTNLGALKIGNRVNVERSTKIGDEVGGHVVSGHVDTTVAIERIYTPENNCIMTFKVPLRLMRYLFDKGFVALNGTSLTIVRVKKSQGTFTVSFIPETLRVTTFGCAEVGDKVNIEIDRATQASVDTVRAVLRSYAKEMNLLRRLADSKMLRMNLQRRIRMGRSAHKL